MSARLIDKIYERCFAPETWPDVLDEIGRIADTTGATLIVSKDDVLRWVASPEPRERAEKFVKEGWLWRGHSCNPCLISRPLKRAWRGASPQGRA
jgi:hypothetical protein